MESSLKVSQKRNCFGVVVCSVAAWVSLRRKNNDVALHSLCVWLLVVGQIPMAPIVGIAAVVVDSKHAENRLAGWIDVNSS